MSQKLEEIKNQILYHLEHIQSRIIESNTFNAFKERYQSRSLLHQRLIKYGAIGVIIFVISFIPLYYFYLSSEHWSEFKEKRKLSLDLLKVRNYKSHFSDISEYRLKKNISDIVKKYKNKDYLITDKKAPSKEKKLKKVIYEVKVEHLNIRQAVQIGKELNDILPAYLSSLTIKESTIYPKHYDVVFEVFAYFHKIKNFRKSSRVRKNKEKKNKKPSRFRRDKKNKKSKDDKKDSNKEIIKKDSSVFKPNKEIIKKDSSVFKPNKETVKKDFSGFKFDKDKKPKIRKKLLPRNLREMNAR